MASSARRASLSAARLLRLRWRGVPVWAQLLAAGLIVVVLVRTPAAVSGVGEVLTRGDGLWARWPWACVVVGAEGLSLAGAAAVQRELLAAGGSRLRWRVLFALSLASTGLTRLLPAGLVAGGSWLMGEYRRRGVRGTVAVWVVLAGGVASTVSILALLLAGAALGGVASPPLLAAAAVALALGSAGLIAGMHRAGQLGGWLRRCLPGAQRIRRVAAIAAALLRVRAGRGRWAAALLSSSVGWLGDTGVLAASFGLAGLPVPWRALLFACAAGQLAGRLVPLPGGLGGMEAGLVGALVLTGTAPTAAVAAVILYRVVGYWAVGGAGGAVLAVLTHGRLLRPGDGETAGGRITAVAAGQTAAPAGPLGVSRPVAPLDPVPVAPLDPVPAAPPGTVPAAPLDPVPVAPPGTVPAAPPGTVPAPAPRPVVAGARGGARPGGRRRWWPQFLLVAALLWAVNAAVKLHAGAESAGLAHAAAVESISRSLGGALSLPMNHWLAAHPLPAASASAYYIVLNLVATGAAGILLLRRRPRRYALHRNALIAMGLVALVVFWLYPVAPPRMLPGYHDITATSVPMFAHLLEGTAADEFAALPSLHVGWALWVAVATQAVARRRFWRAAVWVYPVLTVADVVATANHYLLDVISAPGILLLAYILAAVAAPVLTRGYRQWAGAARLRRDRTRPGTRAPRDPFPSQAPARTRRSPGCAHH